jgi:hypothetical protein
MSVAENSVEQLVDSTTVSLTATRTLSRPGRIPSSMADRTAESTSKILPRFVLPLYRSRSARVSDIDVECCVTCPGSSVANYKSNRLGEDMCRLGDAVAVALGPETSNISEGLKSCLKHPLCHSSSVFVARALRCVSTWSRPSRNRGMSIDIPLSIAGPVPGPIRHR